MKTKVKVCGITCRRNLKTLINFPIDFIGLNFIDRSKRKIKKDKAKKIISCLPKHIKPVLIFENEDLDKVIKLVLDLNVIYIQLHGDESVEYCMNLKKKDKKLKIIKAFPSENATLKKLESYKKICDYFLIDSSLNGKIGGTGKVADWKVASQIKKNAGKTPIFLAGGLNPINYKAATKAVNPDFLDINSGFESSIGRKDKDKIKLLFQS